MCAFLRTCCFRLTRSLALDLLRRRRLDVERCLSLELLDRARLQLDLLDDNDDDDDDESLGSSSFTAGVLLSCVRRIAFPRLLSRGK